MKQRISLLWRGAACLCGVLLLLAGCSPAEAPSQPVGKTNSSTTESSQSVQSSQAPQSASKPEIQSFEDWDGTPFLTLDNYPKMDGSTANLPLMAQVLHKAAGVSMEDAEILSNCSTTPLAWEALARGDVDILLVYEAAESTKSAIDMDRLEITPVGRDALVFINNEVEPVAEVTETAKRIAGGSYGTQMENPYRDEIGQLIDAINNMSSQISKSERIKSEFISSVSHELRTPLTAINGWGETLLEDTDRTQLTRGVGIILKESRRLTNMVEELLDFSKMEDGRFTLRIEQVDLQAEFEDTIYTYMELFKQEGIELHYAGDDEIFPPIPADPERLKQVFCNVLDNAAKHGGAGRRIDAAVDRDEERIRITVRDYGPGIPDEELPFVKQKFYKGSSKARGSGIGLAVCDEIIRLHDGSFGIDNAEGGGCVVTITLPAA